MWHDSKVILAGGSTFFGLLTMTLILFHADKEYCMAAFALCGQLVAGFLTYVNSTKPNTPNEPKG